jgi:hypothetical protein
VPKSDTFHSIACIAPVNFVVVPDRGHPPPVRIQPATITDSLQQLAFRSLGLAEADNMLPDRTERLFCDIERSFSLDSIPSKDLRKELSSPSPGAVPAHHVRLPAREPQSNDSL